MTSLHKKTSQNAENRSFQDLDHCHHLHLAVETDRGPYCVPIQHLVLGNTVYFCCNRGDKLCQIFAESPRVCLSGVLDQAPTESGFLPTLQGVLAFGSLELVEGAEEIRQALFGLYYRHTSPDNKQEAWIFSRNEVWAVYKVKIDSVSGD